MYIYKQIKLVTKNSSWWKQIKYRRESAFILARHRELGWKFVKKKLLKNDLNTKDTRKFCIYYLKKKQKFKVST